MIARIRYSDPLGDIVVSETDDALMVRMVLPKDLTQHLEIVNAISRALETLIGCYTEPADED